MGAAGAIPSIRGGVPVAAIPFPLPDAPVVRRSAMAQLEILRLVAEIRGLSGLPPAVILETFTNSSADRIHRMVADALD